jgi:uncharacterized membrane protein
MGGISVDGTVKIIVSIFVFLIMLGAFALIIIGMIGLFNDHFGASLFPIGIGSFILSLVIMSCLTYLSIPAEKGNKRRKSLILDRKEIRRSIAISFTILYILLISFYFYEVEYVTSVVSIVNSTVNETVRNVTTNSSFTTITILNKTTNLTGNGLTGEGLTHLSSIITAFTTVYVVIIGFYFGSRVYEKIKEIKNAEEALKIQYIMDEISEDDFDNKMEKLRRRIKPNSQLKILKPIKSNKKEITIEHRGGENIGLKDIMMVIKIDKKRIKFDLIPSDNNKDGEEPKSNVFVVNDEMVIDMDKIIADDRDVITVNGKSISVKKKDIYDDIGDEFKWKKGEKLTWEKSMKVEVNVIYKPTKEIISTMKKEIDDP